MTVIDNYDLGHFRKEYLFRKVQQVQVSDTTKAFHEMQLVSKNYPSLINDLLYYLVALLFCTVSYESLLEYLLYQDR